MTTNRIWIQLALAAALAVGAAPAAAQLEGDARESYSYLRTLDGSVTVAAPGSGPGEPADANQPLLAGDEVRLARGARAEILLADRNILRLEGGSVLRLTRVAFSADRQDRTTALDLAEGELLLVVTDEALGDELPEIRTPAGTVYVNAPGTYRLETTPEGWAELVVREGYAEMVTDRGSTIVRGGEIASTEGDAWGRVRVAAAGPEDGLERWGHDLHERAAAATRSVTYVEPELAYAAAPLADHGSWIYIDSGWAWRPRVEVGWRPYWRGRWAPTPSGLTWVSSEPWGWVPYHYGTWVIAPSYGWIWRPGYVYSPAWVYWSWGADWTGWCPIGYYSHYYNPWYRHGFRWGIYGWAGGGWGFYGDWNFVPTYCVRERDWRRHHRTGRDLEREGHGRPPHGMITTDTRMITRERLDRPGDIAGLLAARHRQERGTDAPDVTDFVARKRELPPTVTRAIENPETPARLAGTPLVPDAPRGKVAARPESDPQPWRRGNDAPIRLEEPGKRAGADQPRTVGKGSPAAGVAIEDGTPTRVTPSGKTGDGEPRALPRTAPRPEAPATGTSSRQGWKERRGTVGGTPAAPRSDDSPGAVPRTRSEEGAGPGQKTPPVVDREQPVRRVVGGVRKPTTSGTPTTSSPAPRTSAPQAPRAGDKPATSPGSRRDDKPATTPTTPPPGTRYSQAVPSSPRYSQPATPRSSQPAAPSTPRYSQPAAPKYSQPSTPSTPRYSQPSAPRYSQPAAPSTPRYSQPSAPKSSQPAAPSTPRYSAPSSPRSPGTTSAAPRSGGSSSGGTRSTPPRSSPSSGSSSAKPTSNPPPRGGHG